MDRIRIHFTIQMGSDPSVRLLHQNTADTTDPLNQVSDRFSRMRLKVGVLQNRCTRSDEKVDGATVHLSLSTHLSAAKNRLALERLKARIHQHSSMPSTRQPPVEEKMHRFISIATKPPSLPHKHLKLQEKSA